MVFWLKYVMFDFPSRYFAMKIQDMWKPIFLHGKPYTWIKIKIDNKTPYERIFSMQKIIKNVS